MVELALIEQLTRQITSPTEALQDAIVKERELRSKS